MIKETSVQAGHPVHGKLFDGDELKDADCSPRRQVRDRKLSQNREKIR